MVLGLLVGEAALAAKLLDQRVVGGEQLQLAVAKQVGAAVARRERSSPRRPRPAPRSASSPCPSARSRPGRAGGCARWPSSRSPAGRPRATPRRAAPARTTRRRAARPPRRPARRPFRRRPRTRGGRAKYESSLAFRWRPVSDRWACSTTRSISSPGHVELESELRVADPHLVEVLELGLAHEAPSVQERAVGRVHVLNVVAGPAGVDACVEARGVAVLDPHVGIGRAPDREPAEQVEPLAGVEAAAA